DDLNDWSRDVPILIVCLARPDLLDSRPMWAGGKLNSSTIALQPLSPHASDLLIKALAGSSRLTPAERERLLALAEGNPLFLEQMVALAAEQRIEGDVPIPPTIQASLALRLERLPEADRLLLGRAAVVGRRFWAEALTVVM